MSDSIKDIARDLKNYLEYQKTMGASEMPICENSNQRPITSNQKSATDNQGLAAGMNNQRLLDELRDEIGDCKRCRLCEQRTNVVFGVGNPNADLMFVGEGPGRDEDKQGIPFVGRAGQLLTKIIEAMKMQRSDVYIANVVKCLRYNAMVQMGNGKWERIGRLVKHRYKGTVKSIDTNGKIVNKRVVGWHATELGSRKVYKMSFKSARPAGPYKCAIQLTHNHPVLTKRGYVEVQNLQKKDLIAIGQGLSKNVKDIVYGMLLGDGHITKRQSYLSFSHSVKQEDYAKFKIRLLHKELNCSFKHYNVSAGFKKRYPIIQCYTSSHRSLRTIRSRFYDSNNTKIVPQSLAEELTPMTLAIWFMDDGYMRIRPNRQPSAEIATCAFKPEDIKILSKGIKKLGIENYIRGNRIFFNVDFTKKLSKTISPYVPPSMRWKLHPDIRSEIPFNRKLYSASEPETFF
ncbi:hypothetical protein KKA47_01520, partial [bacterium]|nr:hypothetical protein [bacterium]